MKSSHCQKCHKFPCYIVEPCSDQPTGCRSQPCPNQCGCEMHQCKIPDHLYNLCPLQLVPCINQQHGCHIQLRREQINAHLHSCSACVLQCPALWHRTIQKSKLPAVDLLHRNVNPHTLVTRHFSKAMKLADIQAYHADLAANEDNYQLRKTVGDQPWGLLNPNLVDDSCMVIRWLPDTLHGSRDPSTRTFYCLSIVRRDEYSAHMALHSDCYNSLHYVEQPCPLHYRGCDFVLPRTIPQSLDHQLRFHTLQRTFVWSLSGDATPSPPVTTPQPWLQSAAFSLLDLPNDILYVIFSHLDSPSLENVASTCWQLRQLILQSVNIGEHCVVYKTWHRVNTGHLLQPRIWRQSGKVMRHFARVSTTCGRQKQPVRWCVNPHLSGLMQRHLKECSFYERLPLSSAPVKCMLSLPPIHKAQ